MATQLSNEVLGEMAKVLEGIMVGGLCIELSSITKDDATFKLHMTDKDGHRIACVFTKALGVGGSVTMTGMHKALQVTLG